MYEELIKYTKDFEEGLETFKENERSIHRALHIPYSGFDPDYMDYQDFINDDCNEIIIEVIDEYADEYDENEYDNEYEYLLECFDRYDEDGRLHEFVDSSLIWHLSLRESVVIIENCDEEETDYGLWEGQQPEEAIKTKAFFSYRNDVYWRVKKLIESYT